MERSSVFMQLIA